MGCFSYLCKKCGKGVESTSFDGQECILFLLDNGQVVEQMEGKYDSYGRVFKENGKHKYFLHIDVREKETRRIEAEEDGSFFWNHNEWGALVDKAFNDNPEDGFAIFHKKCYDGVLPTTKSDDDPNQGWGEDGEHMTNTGKL